MPKRTAAKAGTASDAGADDDDPGSEAGCSGDEASGLSFSSGVVDTDVELSIANHSASEDDSCSDVDDAASLAAPRPSGEERGETIAAPVVPRGTVRLARLPFWLIA